MAPTAPGGETPSPLGGHSGGRGAEHGLRAGASEPLDDSRDTRPDRATRYVETTLGVLSYTDLAPHLAERVTQLEADLFKGQFAVDPLDEHLVLTFHQRICGDLVPAWAGRWRTVAVSVGPLQPPHAVPLLMRDYARDLTARWPHATDPELLAFAEGRFLAIHPFRDFNGRTVRVLLNEILRRLDLPPVALVPDTEPGRQRYFEALEAADRHDWQPLAKLWRERFQETQN